LPGDPDRIGDLGGSKLEAEEVKGAEGEASAESDAPGTAGSDVLEAWSLLLGFFFGISLLSAWPEYETAPKRAS